MFSLCTLASRLVFDDKYMFKEMANRMLPVPSRQFMFRALFRLFEVSSRLIVLAFIWSVFSGITLIIWWAAQVIVLTVMYQNGMLGYEIWNVVGYFIAVPDLGIKQREEAPKKCSFLSAVCCGCFCPALMCLSRTVNRPWNIAYWFYSSNLIQNVVWLFAAGVFAMGRNPVGCIACPP